LLAWQWTIGLAAHYRANAGPVGLTVAASVMVGIGALAALLPGATLTWDAIIAPGGFWDLTLWEFMSLSIDIARRAIPTLLATLQFDDERRNFQAWIAAALALWFVRMAIGLIAAPRHRGGRFLIAELATFAVGVFGAIYTGPLLLWSVNRLNFWLFLLLVLFIQDWRYDEPPLVVRLAARLTGRARRHQPLPDNIP